MNYITIILLVLAGIVIGLGMTMLFAKVTMQDKEILFWAKAQTKSVQLADINMKGINSLQKLILYQQALLKQLTDCNLEGGVVVFKGELERLQESAIAEMDVYQNALVSFTNKYRDNKEAKEDMLAQSQLQEQLYNILGTSPNKGVSG